MREYHKIKTVYTRNPETNYKTLIEGEFASPEFKFLADNTWTWTEKIDGMNIRTMWDGESIIFGGKTDRAQIPAELLNRLNERFLLKKELFVKTFDYVNPQVCFYLEGVGPKIQKGGGNYGDKQDVVLFDIRIGEWWLKRTDVEEIAEIFDLPVSPIIGYGTLYDMIELTKMGFISEYGIFKAEGIVARPEVELKARNGSRIITKIKFKDFV